MEEEPKLLCEVEDECVSNSIRSSKKRGVCEICKSIESKYVCPKCACITCSAECVRAHKRTRQCDGVRPKSELIPAAELSLIHLLKDYSLLENTSLCVERSARLLSKHTHTHAHTYVYRYDKNSKRPYIHKLKELCIKRNIQLNICPIELMDIRKNNTTAIVGKHKNKIAWKLQWILPAHRITFYDKRVSEENTLSDALYQTILKHRECENEHKDVFKHILHQGLDKYIILMKQKEDGYIRLDSNQSIESNLSHTTIIEFPTFLIITESDLSQYTICARSEVGVVEAKESDPTHQTRTE